MATEEVGLRERLDALESEVKMLKAEKSSKEGKTKMGKELKIKKEPRAPSEYNKFVKQYIEEQKSQYGSEFKHKEAFKGAAAAWSAKKEEKA
jgi:hypothetical protein